MFWKKKNTDPEDQEDDIEMDTEEDDREENGGFGMSGLTVDTKRSIAAIFSFVFTFLFVLGFFEQAGIIGRYLDLAASTVFGWGKWLFPALLILIGLILLRRKIRFYIASIIGITVTYLSLLGLAHVFHDQEMYLMVAKNGEGGGMVGYFLAASLVKLVGFVGGVVVLIALCLIGILVTYNYSLIPWVDKTTSLIKGKKEGAENDEEGEDDDEEEDNDEDEDEDEGEDEDEDEHEEQEAERSEEDFRVSKSISKSPNIRNIRFDGEEVGEDVSKDAPSRPICHEAVNSMEEDEGGVQDLAQEPKEKKGLFGGIFNKKKTRKVVEWELPPVDLLVKMTKKPNSGNVQAKQSAIQETLRQFDIPVESEGYRVGPTVTQYRFRPAPGVRLEKIVALSSNLAMELAAHPIRIEAPIPGKSLVGIEVPNKDPAYVNLRQKLEEPTFIKKRQSKLTLILGKDVSGDYVLGNLDKMPHLLVAGATNSGKSVCINSILLSLLYQCTPEELKFILIDPKRVEMSLYEGIPHLITPVIVENKKAVRVLKWAVGEMERRLKLLSELKSRDISSYNEKIEKRLKKNSEYDEYPKLSFIIIVIDELADLMITNGKDIESAIVRLAQMARAVGMHLIVSTQKPIADVITSLIKSNITTRIAFKVATQIDSRTILDKGGAERLVGKGDMLYSTANSSELRRIQGVLVTEKEVKKVVSFLQNQKEEMEEDGVEFDGEESEDVGIGENDIELEDDHKEHEHEDSLFGEAKDVVAQEKKASTSLLQRRLRIGYNRAARLIDELEADGVIGPQNGSKPREVLMDIEQGGDVQEEQGDGSQEHEEDLKQQKERDTW